MTAKLHGKLPPVMGKKDYIRNTQIIDAAWEMVCSLKGWGMEQWDDPEIQKAALAGAELFIEAVKDRLPTELK
jgi:hypothetical protein